MPGTLHTAATRKNACSSSQKNGITDAIRYLKSEIAMAFFGKIVIMRPQWILIFTSYVAWWVVVSRPGFQSFSAQTSENGCGFNRSMQHLISNTGEEDVEDETATG
jgi:hypothetical protein